MANLFDNLSSRVFTRSNQLVEDGLNKLIPGDNLIAKSARSFLGNQAERLLANGLFPGGENSQVQGLQNVRFTAENDIRARLSLSPQSGSLFYRDPSNRLMSPLSETDGVVWPYTPSVNVSYNAAYSGQNPSHTNYTQQSYAHSTVDQIQVVGQFTANNQDEARYLLATLWFLKSATKSFFGTDNNRGTPPPVLRFSAHGAHMFKSVPVVVANTTQDFEQGVDYIDTPIIAGSSGRLSDTTRVPTLMTINCTLIPVISRAAQTRFGLRDYAAGRLLGSSIGRGGTP